MYWHELNEKRIWQLRQWLKNKSVIVVGNSIKLLSAEYCDLIDIYDCVVRIGKGIPNLPIDKHVGVKTDLWFSGMLRAGLYDQINCKWKILTPSSSLLFDKYNVFMTVNKALFHSNFQPYKDYFWSDSLDNTRAYWSRLGFNKDTRPSQGIVCCDFLLRRVKHPHIDIIGFDFFEQFETIDGVDYKSWHMPKKIPNQENAHDSVLEKSVINMLSEKYSLTMLPYK